MSVAFFSFSLYFWFFLFPTYFHMNLIMQIDYFLLLVLFIFISIDNEMNGNNESHISRWILKQKPQWNETFFILSHIDRVEWFSQFTWTYHITFIYCYCIQSKEEKKLQIGIYETWKFISNKSKLYKKQERKAIFVFLL